MYVEDRPRQGVLILHGPVTKRNHPTHLGTIVFSVFSVIGDNSSGATSGIARASLAERRLTSE